MTKNIGQLVGDIYALLEKQTEEENIKILTSVKTLLGINLSFNEEPSVDFQQVGFNPNSGANNNAPSPNVNKGIPKGNAKAYFENKDPQNKGEEFAVAALFLQQNGGSDVHTIDTFRDVIKNQARRKFDEHNFYRDIKNCIHKAKFFISGDSKGEYFLSSIGENYVEALPDRVAAQATRKKTSGTKKKSPKKKAKIK